MLLNKSNTYMALHQPTIEFSGIQRRVDLLNTSSRGLTIEGARSEIYMIHIQCF